MQIDSSELCVSTCPGSPAQGCAGSCCRAELSAVMKVFTPSCT